MTTPVTSSGGTTTSSLFNPSTGSGSSALTSDFETFLKLLTTQATNQDPLEPLDSTEYASQLAQFSMVEQQVQGNDLLAGMQAQMALSTMATVTQWVGMDARAAVNGQFDGSSPVVVSPNPAADADEVRLVIEDSDGNEVNNLLLPISADNYEWDGRNAEGNVVASGSYSFTLKSYRDDELLSETQAEVYSRIRESQMINNQVVLIMDDGSQINSADVTALRAPIA